MPMRPSQLPSIRELMSRDHREDVDRLNVLLSGSGDAKLARDVPPALFTGDIDSVERGNCICLIGINPGLSDKPEKHEQEYIPAERMISRFRSGDESAYSEYIDSRLGYFDRPYANWRHFDKSGRGYPGLAFPGQDKRSVWKGNAFAMDIVPYFSRDARSLDSRRVAESTRTDPSMENHLRAMKEIISMTRPKIIHLNGSHGTHTFERILSPEFELQEKFSDYKLKFGFVDIGGRSIKVIAHNQFASWQNNPNKEHWPMFIEEWRRWCSENEQGPAY